MGEQIRRYQVIIRNNTDNRDDRTLEVFDDKNNFIIGFHGGYAKTVEKVLSGDLAVSFTAFTENGTTAEPTTNFPKDVRETHEHDKPTLSYLLKSETRADCEACKRSSEEKENIFNKIPLKGWNGVKSNNKTLEDMDPKLLWDALIGLGLIVHHLKGEK